jgi:hypothetical protein
MENSEQILQNYLDDSIKTFRSYKDLADKAMAQVSDEQFFQMIDEESNSIAIIAKHIGGNLRSRWTDFLTTDGEKADRDRDSEFVSEADTRQSLAEFWERGWSALFTTLGSLRPADLGKTTAIRGQDHTVVKAINRSIAHTASHVGQIIFLAKHLQSSNWKTLSIPRNNSGRFNAFLHQKAGQGAANENPYESHTEFKKELSEKKS